MPLNSAESSLPGRYVGCQVGSRTYSLLGPSSSSLVRLRRMNLRPYTLLRHTLHFGQRQQPHNLSTISSAVIFRIGRFLVQALGLRGFLRTNNT